MHIFQVFKLALQYSIKAFSKLQCQFYYFIRYWNFYRVSNIYFIYKVMDYFEYKSFKTYFLSFFFFSFDVFSFFTLVIFYCHQSLFWNRLRIVFKYRKELFSLIIHNKTIFQFILLKHLHHYPSHFLSQSHHIHHKASQSNILKYSFYPKFSTSS